MIASSPRGFTLVELLVSMTLLGLLVLFVSQLTNSAAATAKNTGQRMDSDAQARLLFSRLDVELSKMVKRADLDYSAFKSPASTLPAAYGGAALPANLQAGPSSSRGANDRLAFYAESVGYYSGSAIPTKTQRAPLSMVAYMVSSDPHTSASTVLRRMSKGLGWDPEPANAWSSMNYLPVTLALQWPNLFNNSDPDYDTVSSQIFRLEYTYLLKSTATTPAHLSVTPYDTTASPPHTSVNGFRDVAALVVAIAVLDSSSRVIVNDYTSLIESLPDAVDSKDIQSTWVSVINSANYGATAKIPQAAASAVRVYQRYFPLDVQ